MGFKRIISLCTVTLAVMLVLGHNIFPHHHGKSHVGHSESCVVHFPNHVCVESNETHIDVCGGQGNLCKEIYEFLGSGAQISHLVQVCEQTIDVEPHVCTCKSEYNVITNVLSVESDWQRHLPKRGPPFLA